LAGVDRPSVARRFDSACRTSVVIEPTNRQPAKPSRLRQGYGGQASFLLSATRSS